MINKTTQQLPSLVENQPRIGQFQKVQAKIEEKRSNLISQGQLTSKIVSEILEK